MGFEKAHAYGPRTAIKHVPLVCEANCCTAACDTTGFIMSLVQGGGGRHLMGDLWCRNDCLSAWSGTSFNDNLSEM